MSAAPTLDFYASYCATIAKVWGADKCPTREQWDAMCSKPRARKLTPDETDDNLFAIENGDGAIYP